MSPKGVKQEKLAKGNLSRVEEVLQKFNEGSKNSGEVILLESDEYQQDIPVISSGILSVDQVLGIGGFPQGRVVEIFGPESGGKSTLAIHTVASAQKAGGIGAYVDVEHSFLPSYARTIGVKVENLLFSQPDSAENALTIVENLVQLLGHGDVVVVDSVAALVPQKELDGDYGDMQMGAQARLMSQAMRKLTGLVSERGVLLIFINQIRYKIGVVYGSNETTTGGAALKYYSSIRLDVRKGALVKKGEESIGGMMKVRAVKNKVASPFKECEIELRFGKGIYEPLDLLFWGEKLGIITKTGHHFYVAGSDGGEAVCIGTGKEKAAEYLLQDEQLSEKIRFASKASFNVKKCS